MASLYGDAGRANFAAGPPPPAAFAARTAQMAGQVMIFVACALQSSTDMVTRTVHRLGRGIEKLVGSDVHQGEWHIVGLFFVNLFLLLTAYYILKVVREPLILLGGGAVSRSYARGSQAGLL
jgi:hypothetical protein